MDNTPSYKKIENSARCLVFWHLVYGSDNRFCAVDQIKYAGDAAGRATFFLFSSGTFRWVPLRVLHEREKQRRSRVRTTMTISALIVGTAAFHYYYMRGVMSTAVQSAPTTGMIDNYSATTA